MPSLILNRTPFNVAFSRNEICYSIKTTYSLSLPNLKLLLDVYVETKYLSGTFTKVVSLEAAPNSLGIADFYIQSILDTYLNYDMPSYNEFTLKRCENTVRRYYVKYSQQSGTTIDVLSYTQVSTKYVVLGGIAFEEYQTAGFFSNYLPASKMFLTWQPDEKPIAETDQEYLYWYIINSGITGLKLQSTVYFTDGTSTSTIHLTVSGTLQYSMIYCSAGYTQLSLGSINPAKTIYKYTIQLLNQSSVLVSEVKTFVVDRKYYPHYKQFLFGNSLGGISVARFTGVFETDVEVTKSQFESVPKWNYLVKNGKKKSYFHKEQIDRKAHSGYISYKQLDALRDMLLSDLPFEIFNEQFLGIIINAKSFAIYKDDDNLFNLKFEYEYDFTNRVYTGRKLRNIASAGLSRGPRYTPVYNNTYHTTPTSG